MQSKAINYSHPILRATKYHVNKPIIKKKMEANVES